jgi:hypothetical protein
MEVSEKPTSLAPKGYSPNDFFWVSAKEELETINCDSVIDESTTITCSDSNINETDIKTCYQAELCKNKNYSKWLGEIQQKHSGADMRNLDSQNSYNFELRNTFNLGIGILGIMIFSYMNRK